MLYIVTRDGYRRVEPESDDEELLSEWINSDVQTDKMLLDDAKRLVAGGYTQSNPLIGNRYKAYFDDGYIYLAVCRFNHFDDEHYVSYEAKFLELVLSGWSSYLRNEEQVNKAGKQDTWNILGTHIK